MTIVVYGQSRPCDDDGDDDCCWDFNISFSKFSVISAQPTIFFVLSMIESMGVRKTEPD